MFSDLMIGGSVIAEKREAPTVGEILHKDGCEYKEALNQRKRIDDLLASGPENWLDRNTPIRLLSENLWKCACCLQESESIDEIMHLDGCAYEDALIRRTQKDQLLKNPQSSDVE